MCSYLPDNMLITLLTRLLTQDPHAAADTQNNLQTKSSNPEAHKGHGAVALTGAAALAGPLMMQTLGLSNLHCFCPGAACTDGHVLGQVSRPCLIEVLGHSTARS